MDIRRVDLSTDLLLLQQFFRDVFGREAAAEIWKWKYCPPWGSQVYAWAGFKSGKVVGHAGIVQLRGLVNGRETPFFQLGDIAVDPVHRLKWGFLNFGTGYIFKAVAANYPEHMYYGFAGRRTALYYGRQGGEIVEDACDRILRIDEKVSFDEDLKLQKLAWDDEAIDRLWESMKPLTGIIRDRVYLDWRYVRYPQYTHRLLGVYKRETLTGWLVVTEASFDGQCRDEVRVLDHLIPGELLTAALHQVALETSAQATVFWCPERLWDGESRTNNWMVVCNSNVKGYSSKQAVRDLHYGLGEADEWWW